MDFITKISNRVLGLVLNYCFPLSHSVNTIRRRLDRVAGVSSEKLKKRFPKAQFEPFNIDHLDAEQITAQEDSEHIILYIHGGGYVSGSIHAYRRFLLKLSFRCKAKVIAINYRLAPESPYPAAIQDTIKALKHIQSRFPHHKPILGGDSAGGGLVLGVCLYLQNLRETLPDKIFVISPWADLVGTGRSMILNQKNDVWLSKEHIKQWAPLYYGKHDPTLPYISPIYGEFHHWPSTFIMVGDQEVLLDDANRIFENIYKNNKSVQLYVAKDMQHDWIISLPWLKESKASMSALNNFILES